MREETDDRWISNRSSLMVSRRGPGSTRLRCRNRARDGDDDYVSEAEAGDGMTMVALQHQNEGYKFHGGVESNLEVRVPSLLRLRGSVVGVDHRSRKGQKV